MKYKFNILFIGILLLIFSKAAIAQTAMMNYTNACNYFRSYQRDSALKYFEKGIGIARKENANEILGKCLIQSADLMIYFNLSDSIESYYNQALNIFEKLNNKEWTLRAKVGMLEMPRRTNPSSTMDQYVSLLHEAEQLKNKDLYYLVLEKIVTVNYAMENYTDAIQLTRQCISYYQQKNDSIQLGIKHRSIGNFYMTNRPDSAQYYYEKALKYFIPVKAYLYIVYNYQSMAWLNMERNVHLALIYTNIADSIDQKYQLNSVQLPLIKSFILNKLNKIPEAIIQAKRSYHLALKSKLLFVAFQSANALAGYYKKIKNIDSAMFYTERYAVIKDSIRSEKQYKDAGRMQAKMEFDRKLYEKEISQKEEIKRKELIEWFSISAGLFGLLLAIVAYITFINYRKKTQVIIAQNEERALLIKEIHHRIKNNLSVITGMLELQYREITETTLKHIFMDAISRVNSMALVHKHLYEQNDFSQTNLQSYFEHLFKSVYEAYKRERVNIQFRVETNNIYLNSDTLIPLALMINELLTNSLKYAFTYKKEGVIELIIRKTDTGLKMEYSDNGQGFNIKENTNKGLGSRLIEGLSEQLDAVLIDKNPLEGFAYAIHFKEISNR